LDDGTLFWTKQKGELQGSILLVIEEAQDFGRKDRRLEEAHGQLYVNGVLDATSGSLDCGRLTHA